MGRPRGVVGLVALRLRFGHQDGDLLLDAVGRGLVVNLLDTIQFGQALDQVIDPEHDVGTGVLGPVLDLIVLFHVGEEEDGDDEGPALELVFDGVADAQGAVHGLAQGVGHLFRTAGALAEQGAVFHPVGAALHLDGEAGDILDPDDKVYLGAVPGCFDPVEGLTGDLGGFSLLVDAEFRLALGVVVVIFRKCRVYTHIVLTSLFFRVGFQVGRSVAVATIASGEAVKAPGGSLHGTNSDRIVALVLGLDRGSRGGSRRWLLPAVPCLKRNGVISDKP